MSDDRESPLASLTNELRLLIWAIIFLVVSCAFRQCASWELVEAKQRQIEANTPTTPPPHGTIDHGGTP